MSHHRVKVERWKTGPHLVARKKGRIVTRVKLPKVYVHPPLYRQTVAQRGVTHGEYFNAVVHYYGTSWDDARGHIPELMKRVFKLAHRMSGYHHSGVEDFRISDVALVDYDRRLKGRYEEEEEWGL